MVEKIATLAAVSLCSAFALAGTASAQTNAPDDVLLLHAPGEFMIADGQTKGIAHGNTEHTYRICVSKAALDVPLKVTHDGQQATVQAGSCAQFQAMNIEVTPGGPLPEDFVMFGRYERVG
jgi:hypothetical protein